MYFGLLVQPSLTTEVIKSREHFLTVVGGDLMREAGSERLYITDFEKRSHEPTNVSASRNQRRKGSAFSSTASRKEHSLVWCSVQCSEFPTHFV